MKKPTRDLLVCSMFIIFCLMCFFSVCSGKGTLDLQFEGEAMSACIRNVSQKAVLEEVERRKGIRIEGNLSLLEEKVSVRFKNLPLQDGFRKIRSRFNYDL